MVESGRVTVCDVVFNSLDICFCEPESRDSHATVRRTGALTTKMDEYYNHVDPRSERLNDEKQRESPPPQPTLLHMALMAIARQLSYNNAKSTDERNGIKSNCTKLRNRRFKMAVMGIINTGKSSWLSRIRSCFVHTHMHVQDATLGWVQQTTVVLALNVGSYTIDILDVPGTQFYLQLENLKNASLDAVLIVHNLQYLTTFFPALAAHERLGAEGIPTILINYQLKALYPLDTLIAQQSQRHHEEERPRIRLEVTIPAVATAEDLIRPILLMLESMLKSPLTEEWMDPLESDDATVYSRASLDSLTSMRTLSDEVTSFHLFGSGQKSHQKSEQITYGIPNLAFQDAVEWLGFDDWADLEQAYIWSLNPHMCNH